MLLFKISVVYRLAKTIDLKKKTINLVNVVKYSRRIMKTLKNKYGKFEDSPSNYIQNNSYFENFCSVTFHEYMFFK